MYCYNGQLTDPQMPWIHCFAWGCDTNWCYASLVEVLLSVQAAWRGGFHSQPCSPHGWCPMNCMFCKFHVRKSHLSWKTVHTGSGWVQVMRTECMLASILTTCIKSGMVGLVSVRSGEHNENKQVPIRCRTAVLLITFSSGRISTVWSHNLSIMVESGKKQKTTWSLSVGGDTYLWLTLLRHGELQEQRSESSKMHIYQRQPGDGDPSLPASRSPGYGPFILSLMRVKYKPFLRQRTNTKKVLTLLRKCYSNTFPEVYWTTGKQAESSHQFQDVVTFLLAKLQLTYSHKHSIYCTTPMQPHT